ncbi:MAG TPA: NrsF family protein [Kofleriaceae bacterium]|nr:NrsF family protein [Kofleriaceae bacterium]
MSDPVDRALDALAKAPTPAPALGNALEAELAALAPASPRRPARQLAIALAASLVYAGCLLAVLTIRRDLGELPRGWLVGVGAAWLGGFALPLYLALVPKRGSMTPRWQAAAALAIVLSLAFVVLGWNVHPSGPSSLYYGWERFSHGQGCLWLGLATALVPVALGSIFLRGALPIRSRWIAAALGAGGGCLGGLLLHMHCRITDRMHVGLIHGGVVVVAAVLAAIIVPRTTDRPFAD